MYNGRRFLMKKKVLILCLCTSLLAVTGCGKIPKLSNGEEIVAKIDGKDITANDIYKELKKSGGTSSVVNMIDAFIADKEIADDDTAKATAEVQLKTIKDQYGDNFKSALLSAGYSNEEEFLKDLILEYKKNKVVEKYLAEKLTDDDIKKYYDEQVFGDITAKHILIKPVTTSDMTDEQKTAAENEARDKASALITRLANGEDFATLAKENSDDEGTAKDGGELTFSKDQVVSEFWTASAALKDGEYTTTPVKSTYGYHVILRVSQKEKPSLDDKKDDIIDKLVSKQLTDDTRLSMKTWVDIRKKYNLEIIDSDIKANYDNTVDNLNKDS